MKYILYYYNFLSYFQVYFFYFVQGIFLGDVYEENIQYDYNGQPHIAHIGKYSKEAAQMLLNGSTIAIKTHEGWWGMPPFRPEKYDKAIIVIRDIYGSILSEYKRKHRTTEFLTADGQLDGRMCDTAGKMNLFFWFLFHRH